MSRSVIFKIQAALEFATPEVEATLHETSATDVRAGPHGRIIFPKELLDDWHLADGETLSARLEDGKIVLEPLKE